MPTDDPAARDAHLDQIHQVNDQLQDWVSAHGADLPPDLLTLLSDLDWVLNGP